MKISNHPARNKTYQFGPNLIKAQVADPET